MNCHRVLSFSHVSWNIRIWQIFSLWNYDRMIWQRFCYYWGCAYFDTSSNFLCTVLPWKSWLPNSSIMWKNKSKKRALYYDERRLLEKDCHWRICNFPLFYQGDTFEESRNGLPVFPNLIKEYIPLAVNHLWVSDITYLPVRNKSDNYVFCYLSLILDTYSEEIVGWCVGETLAFSLKKIYLCLRV